MNENHHKVCLNNGFFSKILSKTTPQTHSDKKQVILQVTKSPWKTMDGKGANTFPFHNISPLTQENISKVFPVLFSLSFCIKENSVATLANRNICDTT